MGSRDTPRVSHNVAHRGRGPAEVIERGTQVEGQIRGRRGIRGARPRVSEGEDGDVVGLLGRARERPDTVEDGRHRHAGRAVPEAAEQVPQARLPE